MFVSTNVCLQGRLFLLEEWLPGRTRGKREEFVNYERGISLWIGAIHSLNFYVWVYAVSGYVVA